MASPPAKKLSPRKAGPGSDVVGNPPPALYFTTVNAPDEVHPGAATVVKPVEDPAAVSAPPFTITVVPSEKAADAGVGA